MNAWPGIIVVLTALSLIVGCASSPYVGTGAALGGGLGHSPAPLSATEIPGRAPRSGA